MLEPQPKVLLGPRLQSRTVALDGKVCLPPLLLLGWSDPQLQPWGSAAAGVSLFFFFFVIIFLFFLFFFFLVLVLFLKALLDWPALQPGLKSELWSYSCVCLMLLYLSSAFSAPVRRVLQVCSGHTQSKSCRQSICHVHKQALVSVMRLCTSTVVGKALTSCELDPAR